MTTEELILKAFAKENTRTVIVSCEEKDLMRVDPLKRQDIKLIIKALDKSIGALKKKPEHKDLLEDYENVKKKFTGD